MIDSRAEAIADLSNWKEGISISTFRSNEELVLQERFQGPTFIDGEKSQLGDFVWWLSVLSMQVKRKSSLEQG